MGSAAAARPAAVGAAWSLCGGAGCIRLRNLAPGVDVQVRPAVAAARGAFAGGQVRSGPDALSEQFPAMAGRLVQDGDDVCFVPRFPFVDGTSYAVAVAGVSIAILTRPRPEQSAVTEVLAIYPTAAEVPRNLLRFYIWFSAPMSEGYAAQHVRLLEVAGDDPPTGAMLTGATPAGATLTGAMLPGSELWSGDRRRLTVLLDPARIKRGLAPHREAGYPLHRGEPFRLVVDAGFRDAAGRPLRSTAERRYAVGPDERGRVDPGAWAVSAPPAGAREPLAVTFDRPLDHGLLGRCLHVTGPDGQPVAGLPEPGPQERSWRLTPRRPWAPGPHQLVVDPILEDLAGNSVSRVFDRDLARTQDDPRLDRPAAVTFRST
jgi:hypothetical protein